MHFTICKTGAFAFAVALLLAQPVCAQAPNYPSKPIRMNESGLPGFVTETRYGVLVPAGTPAEIISTLNNVIVTA